MITYNDLSNYGTTTVIEWLQNNQIEYSWVGNHNYENYDAEEKLMFEWALIAGENNNDVIINISKNNYMRFKLAF